MKTVYCNKTYREQKYTIRGKRKDVEILKFTIKLYFFIFK